MRGFGTLGLVTLVLASTDAAAMKTMEREVTCPIDGESFLSVEMISSTSVCTRLDFKQLGYVKSPPPIHECPASKFSFVRDDFSESELAALRPWVESPEYAESLPAETPYYRLARAYERVGRPTRDIAWHLLRASWEAEPEPERSQRYLAEAHESLETHVARSGILGRTPSTEPEQLDLLLLVELRRRHGRFEAAAELIEFLLRPARLDAAMNREVVAFQAELVAEEDASVHYVPRSKEKLERCLRFERPELDSSPPGPEPAEEDRRGAEERLRRQGANSEGLSLSLLG